MAGGASPAPAKLAPSPAKSGQTPQSGQTPGTPTPPMPNRAAASSFFSPTRGGAAGSGDSLARGSGGAGEEDEAQGKARMQAHLEAFYRQDPDPNLRLKIHKTTRWSSRVSLPQIFEGHVTKFAPRKTLQSIAGGKLSFDQRVVLHRVDV